MRLNEILVFIFACVCPSSVLSASNTLPKNFKLCKKTDPNLNKCLQFSIVDAMKKMKNGGIPSLGVLSLEPLVINDIKIDDTNPDRPVSLRLHFKNIKMYGIPDTTLLDYDARLKEARLLTTAYSPKLWFEADYESNGKILVLPIRGAGRCNITLYDLKTQIDLVFKPEKRNGDVYWAIQKFNNKFSPKKMSVFFDGLLTGERRLNDGINNFLNENWQAIFSEVGGSFEIAFGEVFKEITHRVFSKVPINKIFV